MIMLNSGMKIQTALHFHFSVWCRYFFFRKEDGCWLVVKWNVWSYFGFYAFIFFSFVLFFCLNLSFAILLAPCVLFFVTQFDKRKTATEKEEENEKPQKRKGKCLNQNFTVCLMIQLFEMVVIRFFLENLLHCSKRKKREKQKGSQTKEQEILRFWEYQRNIYSSTDTFG